MYEKHFDALGKTFKRAVTRFQTVNILVFIIYSRTGWVVQTQSAIVHYIYKKLLNEYKI